MIVNLLQFIGVLASMIILHEVGHFAACRLFGVEVEEFGFGFPPVSQNYSLFAVLSTL